MQIIGIQILFMKVMRWKIISNYKVNTKMKKKVLINRLINIQCKF